MAHDSRRARAVIRRVVRPGSLFSALTLSLAGCTAEQVRYRPTEATAPTSEEVAATLFLLGDAGEANADRAAVLEHLGRNVESAARGGLGPPVVVAFLGDNIYEEGAPLHRTDEDQEKLAGQVLAVPPLANVRGVFVPGNHDWAKGAPASEGVAAVARQTQWIREMAGDRDLALLPENGCPGPAVLDIEEAVHLVVIDSEWLLHSPAGPCGSDDDFYHRLTEDLRANRDRPVVILAHHPLTSGGPHGGNVAPFEHGPLVYYLVSKSGVIRQDLASPAYSAMRNRIREAIEASGAPPLLHVAGHDHTLQVIRMGAPGEPQYQLVSGSASRSSPVRRIEGTRYATDGFGYMRVDFLPLEVRVVVFSREVGGGPVRAVFACALARGTEASDCAEAPLLSGGG